MWLILRHFFAPPCTECTVKLRVNDVHYENLIYCRCVMQMFVLILNMHNCTLLGKITRAINVRVLARAGVVRYRMQMFNVRSKTSIGYLVFRTRSKQKIY